MMVTWPGRVRGADGRSPADGASRFGSDRALGPGKIRLLEAIRKSGSISQAGRSLDMSYRRAWLLVDDMNHCFREPSSRRSPAARKAAAGAQPFGRELIEKYRSIERGDGGDQAAIARPGNRAAQSRPPPAKAGEHVDRAAVAR